MDWTNILNSLQEAFMTVLTVGISAITVIAVMYINKLKDEAIARSQSIKNENTRKLVKDALNRVSDLTMYAVTCTQQELVKDIKKSIQEGTNTRDALLNLKITVINDVMSQITPQVEEALTTQIVDLQKYISDMVSTYVYQLKQEEAIY